MDLDEVKKRWVGSARPRAQERWNALSCSFQAVPPSSADDGLLALLEHQGIFAPGARVFDLGCGAGRYSLALAGEAAEVVGLDVSDEMLTLARREAERLRLENTSFIRAAWEDEDLAARGWEGAFDLSLAWLTPAVRDYASFEKFCRSSRGWCVLGNHVARAESLSDRFRLAFGLPPALTAREDIIWAMAALLLQGRRPGFVCLENTWERSSTQSELYEKYLRRLSAVGLDSPEGRECLETFLRAELGGRKELHERLSASIGVLYWRN